MGIRNKFLSKDYKDELASIADKRHFTNEAVNLLLGMCYKIEDNFNNYKMVKREVPSKNIFVEEIVNNVKENCDYINVITKRSKLKETIEQNTYIVQTEVEKRENGKILITYPNEKMLLYEISRSSIKPLKEDETYENKAILTAINIGRCISDSEIIRDFSGWNWSINEKEIESSECNIIYVFLSILLGQEFFDEDYDIEKLKNSISKELFNEIQKVSIQFYRSYDKKQNDIILKKIADDKKKLEQMQDQARYVIDLTDKKKQKIYQIKKIDNLLNDSRALKKAYLEYNSKLPDNKKIFSVSHYEEKIQKDRERIMNEINEINRMQNPIEFMKNEDALKYEIKLYEEKSDISKLQKAFLNELEKKVDACKNVKKITDLIYEIRYLNFLPNCKMKLNNVEEKIIKKAIEYEVIGPISNNYNFDYRILKGIFKSQAICLENLAIKLSSNNNKLKVELYDKDELDSSYVIELPEGSMIEVTTSRPVKIFY